MKAWCYRLKNNRKKKCKTHCYSLENKGEKRERMGLINFFTNKSSYSRKIWKVEIQGTVSDLLANRYGERRIGIVWISSLEIKTIKTHVPAFLQHIFLPTDNVKKKEVLKDLPGFWTHSCRAFCNLRTCIGLEAMPTRSMISRNSASPASHNCCTSSAP